MHLEQPRRPSVAVTERVDPGQREVSDGGLDHGQWPSEFGLAGRSIEVTAVQPSAEPAEEVLTVDGRRPAVAPPTMTE